MDAKNSGVLICTNMPRTMEETKDTWRVNTLAELKWNKANLADTKYYKLNKYSTCKTIMLD